MMRAAGFAPRVASSADRRHRRAAFRLALVISAIAHLVPSGPRRLRVRARGRAGAGRSRAAAAAGAARHCELARLIERPTSANGARPALRRADAARADLREARAVPGDAARRGRRRARARSRIAAGQDGAVPAGAGRSAGRRRARQAAARSVYASFGPAVAAASIAQVHRAEVATDGRGGRREGAAARRRAALQVDLDAFTFAARNARSAIRPRRGGCA